MSTKFKNFAEKALDEMLLAEAKGDYSGFVRRFDPTDLHDFDEATFNTEIKSVYDDLGAYKSRIFLGAVEGNPARKAIRFVWDCTYDKAHSIVVVSVYEKNGQLFVNENMNY